MTTPNIILVKKGVQAKIALALNCTQPYVSLALKGRRTKGKALKIRHIALTEYDGLEVPLTEEQKNKIMPE